MRRSTLLAWGAGLIVLGVLLFFGLQKGGPRSGRRAPALPREHLSGPPVTLATLRGAPALVTFWASWCGPCTKEAPELEHFAQTSTGRGKLVAVDWSDSRSEAQRFIQRHAWTFPVLRDDQGSIGLNYGLTNLPTTFLLDAKGHILQALKGPQTVKSLEHALASARTS